MASIRARLNSGQGAKSTNDIVLNNELAASLCNFLKESLSSASTSNFATACYFQLFRILHDSVNNFPLLVDEKKYSKDIQDVTHKLFELCNSIVASSLQQTTWLRKNYAVKLAPQVVAMAQSSPMTMSAASNSTLNSANTTGLNSSAIGSAQQQSMMANSNASSLSMNSNSNNNNNTNGNNNAQSLSSSMSSSVSSHMTSMGLTVSNQISTSTSNLTITTNATNSSHNSSHIAVGGGPSGGGAILIHNDSSSTLASSSNQTGVSTSNTSGYVGSSGISMNSTSQQTAKSNDNYTTFSDMETGIYLFILRYFENFIWSSNKRNFILFLRCGHKFKLN
jgi:hypothetical protein